MVKSRQLEISTSTSQDPCIVHQLLNEPRRSPNYVLGIGESLICDRFLPDGWYRFHDNGMMPEKCIDRYRCGTHDPVWLMGTHPTRAGQEVTGKACANTGFGANCCGYEIGTINVRHCGAFFVYRLPRVQGCSVAYCAGKVDPCPYGTSSLTGYQPGCVAKTTFSHFSLHMIGNPVLSGPFTSGFCPDGRRYTDFFFTCTVGYSNPYDSNVAFDIVFFIDGKPISTRTHISGFQRNASYHANDLRNAMGHEFDPGRLELEETNRSPTEVKVVSTIPTACNDCSVWEPECYYEMEFWTDAGFYDMYHVGMFTMVQTKATPPHIPEFQIYFPSGRWVKVDKNDVNMIRVEVHVRSYDANNVKRLCGKFSGHPDRLGKDKYGNPISFTRIPSSFIESNR
ncbi:hypothetical protein ACJMK2_018157 [Sinanodonta woodiana]|uniref:UMOD/GP2/OIT3-like D8C domain-containing protein n=1 Tax=Sinanodonta woodiana TaxID=1069815 RepID=A0ABD3UCW0_SINWO